MSFSNRKLKKLAPNLEPGEQVITGALAFAPGGIRRQQLKAGLFGAAGAVAAARKTHEAGSLHLPNLFYVALTDRRLLFTRMGSMLGRATGELLAGVPRYDIVSAGFGQGKQARSVQIVLRNGATVEIEVRRGRQRQWMADLLAQLQVPAPYPAA